MPWRRGHHGEGGDGGGINRTLWLMTTGLTAGLWSGAAAAQGGGLLAMLQPDQMVTLSALAGTIGFAVLSAIALMRSRDAIEIENRRLRLDNSDLMAEADRAEALVNSSEEHILAWEGQDFEPIFVGGMPHVEGMPEGRAAFLAFGKWLEPQSAAAFDRAITRLRERGQHFRQALATRSGHLLEAQGRSLAGRAVVRLRNLSGDRLELAALESRHAALEAEVEAMRAALDLAGIPAWLRGADSRLSWVSQAYVAAVEAADPAQAVQNGVELLGSETRESARIAHEGARPFRHRVATIVRGERRVFDVAEVVCLGLFGGFAVDVTEAEAAKAAHDRMVKFHARTLDHLAAGVAIFGPDRRLRSYNAAYRELFGLDIAFLESQPEEGEILERLRGARKLPEQADFRGWKAQLLSAYQTVEAQESLWVLPDRQMLRVVANPHPEGGVTWIYENVTERLDLETRYNALTRVQGETLDNLAEAVAVFSSDGRLRLHNPAFARLWGLDGAALAARPHFSEVVRAASKRHEDQAVWGRLTACVAGVDETRSAVSGRMDRADGCAIDYATVPLPDGQTMLTFVDVSDSVRVERALTERNEALEAADGLKNAFIHHVSYELRSPLTNIIGFTQLLADPNVGELNAKQREYAGYVMASSDTLLAIVNDILDLATVDAGIMELELSEVDAADAVVAAVEGVRARVGEAGIELFTHAGADLGTFLGDEKRVCQMLYNLLSNAVRFSAPGGRVSVGAERRGDWIEFTVVDQGVGMPPDFVPLAFRPFESRAGGNARGGAGLGLSIVKSFAELHGGSVEIHSIEGKGTSVLLRLPVHAQAAAEAAE